MTSERPTQLKLLLEETVPTRRNARKRPDGRSTNDLTFSAMTGTNDQQFPQIIDLYVESGSLIADVTFGRGIFWKYVPPNRYRLLRSDLRALPPNSLDVPFVIADCANLPYASGALDAIVFDPPYMHTPGGTAHNNHQNYEEYYRNNVAATAEGSSTTRRYWRYTTGQHKRLFVS